MKPEAALKALAPSDKRLANKLIKSMREDALSSKAKQSINRTINRDIRDPNDSRLSTETSRNPYIKFFREVYPNHLEAA